MRYQLWIEDEAKTEIRRLPGHMRQRIHQAVQGLCNELRLNRWRVVYVVDEEWSEVGVLAVRKRPPYDYRDLPELLAELD